MNRGGKTEIKVSPIIVCMVMAFIGGLLIIASYYNVNVKNPFNWWITWGKQTCNSIGTTLVASSIVSIILELSNMKKFYQESMKDILNVDFPLDAYSKEHLEKLRLKLALALYKKENVEIEEEYLKKVYIVLMKISCGRV